VSGLIFHIPHSSTLIPDEFRPDFALSDADLEEEIRLMTDWHTADLFRPAVKSLGAAIEFPVSRLLVDPERFPDDAEEPMSEVGMGVLYTKSAHGAFLRKQGCDTGVKKEQLINEYYAPHHRKLSKAVQVALENNGQAVIIDCHSFPSRALPYEPIQDPDRPDICIGTDKFHTPPKLRDSLIKAFEGFGYRVQIDSPFAGALTPLEHYGSNQSVQAAMIEINRALYMDEMTTEKSAQFDEVSEHILLAIASTVGSDGHKR
jgi:N-formylglutamate deformylase